MNLSPLQKARYQYSPKLPGMLRGGISEISVKVGAPTESVADQAKIKALFPNTYGKEEITFVKGSNTSAAKKQVVGVILSGGQAPGGHNVICVDPPRKGLDPAVIRAMAQAAPERIVYVSCNPATLARDAGLLRDEGYLVRKVQPVDMFCWTSGMETVCCFTK